MDAFDVVIIGAGPAGLTAATYLARFRRRVLLLGAGPPRASWIPESHNTPGFPHGVSGPAILGRLTEQAAQYGVAYRELRVEALSKAGEVFEAVAGTHRFQAPAVLLATGVEDVRPPIAGLDEAVRRSLVRMCPICDAYEAIGRRIAVLGEGPLAQREAAFLRTYSDDIAVLDAASGQIVFGETEVEWTPHDGASRRFDCLYLALGCRPQSALALACGAERDDNGDLLVDSRQMTSVAGLYAAGDVVRGLNQIAVATGEAAIAATAVHNRLREAAR